jgi:hypothetical protein
VKSSCSLGIVGTFVGSKTSITSWVLAFWKQSVATNAKFHSFNAGHKVVSHLIPCKNISAGVYFTALVGHGETLDGVLGGILKLLFNYCSQKIQNL